MQTLSRILQNDNTLCAEKIGNPGSQAKDFCKSLLLAEIFSDCAGMVVPLVLHTEIILLSADRPRQRRSWSRPTSMEAPDG